SPANNSVTIAGNGAVFFGGANTYTGTTEVQSGATLKLGNALAVGTASGGTVTVDAGGASDLNKGGPKRAKQFVINGSGVGGVNPIGALVNNGTPGTGQNNISKITLNSDAAMGGTGRFDIRSNNPILELNGHTLTKFGANQISVVAATIQSTGGPGSI